MTFLRLEATLFLKQHSKVLRSNHGGFEIAKLHGDIYEGQRLNISRPEGDEDEEVGQPRTSTKAINIDDLSHVESDTRKPEWSCKLISII